MIRFEGISKHEYVGTPIMTDVDFALDIFSQNRKKAVTLFRTYTNECLELKEKPKPSDREVIEYLNTLGIINISELQKLEKGQRDDAIKKIKEMHGVTVRQLARITGISKSVIDRI